MTDSTQVGSATAFKVQRCDGAGAKVGTELLVHPDCPQKALSYYLSERAKKHYEKLGRLG